MLLAAALLASVQSIGAQPTRAAPSSPPIADEVPAELELFVGETRVLPSPKVARIAVGNGRVLSASVVDERDILLIANEAGATMIHTWSSDGRTRRYNVQVRPADMSRTTREILDFLSGSSNVKARAVGDRVLVEGQNLTDEQLFRIDELAKRYQIVNFRRRRLGANDLMDAKCRVGRQGRVRRALIPLRLVLNAGLPATHQGGFVSSSAEKVGARD